MVRSLLSAIQRWCRVINIYHCKKCHHEWESIKYEFRCPRCGAEVAVMVEMPLQFYHQLIEDPESLEEKQRKTDKGTGQPYYKTECAVSATDKRKEIERLYASKRRAVRKVIEKHVKCIVVERDNNNFLTARINKGKIEIIDEPSGMVVPWNQLNENEQWIIWNNFNDLLVKIKTIRRKK